LSRPAIQIQGLSKRFVIGEHQGSVRDIRESLARLVKGPFAKKKSTPHDEIWALNDLSAEIGEGEVVGIVGRNGAGKSTLLKILSRITEPTRGKVHIRGRVASLLEVGTGFHQELTGRENVFLNGSILGMSRAEIVKKFDEIVAFAGVERFIDTPVKHFSSGMAVRLAFSVAAHLEPEILLVDEVLSVGDAAFQRKSLGKMDSVAKEGRTVVVVSHNLAHLRSLCPRGLWLDGGTLRSDGQMAQVVAAYLNEIGELGADGPVTQSKDGRFRITRVAVLNHEGEATPQIETFRPFSIRVEYEAQEKVSDPLVGIRLDGPFGPIGAFSMILDGATMPSLDGEGAFSIEMDEAMFLPRHHVRISLVIHKDGGNAPLVAWTDVGAFEVYGEAEDIGLSGYRATMDLEHVVQTLTPYRWVMPDSRVHEVKPGRTRPNAESS
jgi:lipopolysaccharide transport system ATP-binding protein